jgi:hypothetical protein
MAATKMMKKQSNFLRKSPRELVTRVGTIRWWNSGSIPRVGPDADIYLSCPSWRRNPEK